LATVITSLASALPLIGHAVVAWLWGGFNHQSPPSKNFAYCGKNLSNNNYNSLIKIEDVKMLLLIHLTIVGQSAGVCYWYQIYYMCLQIYETSALYRFYTSDTASQRLNAKQQAWLVGFYEANGWFGMSCNGKYIQYECALELSIKDMPLLHQIKNLLNVSGSVRPRKDYPEIVTFKIRNKNDLKTKIVPIFERFPMISSKRFQFENFKKCLCDLNLIYTSDLTKSELTFYKNQPDTSIKSILATDYFNDWLVGFINGKGRFCVHKPTKNNNVVCSFEIDQTVNGSNLCKAIRRKFKIRAKVYKNDDNTNHFFIKTSSVESVKNVLYFLAKNEIKLKGYKHIQFVLWVKQLRMIPRYTNHMKIPTKL
jgi:ubiquinol-cytochrome c reductase cytochrome b subunit